jgi:hypothetical protein
MKFRLAMILFCAFHVSQVWAYERHEFYNGVRMLGMGGAGVATVNDETALLVNPAALGKLRDYFITIADPEIDVGVQTEEIAGTDVLKVGNPQDMLAKGLANPDRFLHTRAQIFPSIVVPNFGFGFFARNEVNAEYRTADNKYHYDYTNDYAAVFGFNFRIWDGIIKLGANTRIMNHTKAYKDDIDPTSTNLTLKSLASEGVGVGSDAGLLLTAPIVWLPTLGAVYRDVGRTTYNLRDGLLMKTTERPDSTASTVDVGLSLHPIVGKRTRMTWTVEYQDILTYSDEKTQMNRIHGGVEFNYADALFIRAGMNQQYWTAGMELSMMNYQFQAATYGENIGDCTTAREDRRYVAKFAFRF